MRSISPSPFSATHARLLAACAVLLCAQAAAALQAPARNPTPPGRSTNTSPPSARTTPPPSAATTPAPRPSVQPTPPSRISITPTPVPTSDQGILVIRHGETFWSDWLWLLGGVLFAALLGYMVYGAMLYNIVGNNRHPANFRKLLISFVLLLSIIWFGYVFWHAFGLLMFVILFVVWLAVALIFIFTKRKVGVAQQQ